MYREIWGGIGMDHKDERVGIGERWEGEEEI
jgi:hypothetical protein